jgi:acetyl esterase/lipase
MSLNLDPEVAEVLAPMAAQSAVQTPPPVGDALARRASQEETFEHVRGAMHMADDVVIANYQVTVPDGAQILARWYAKQGSSPGSAVLYTHGGGLIAGNVGQLDNALSQYVSASGTPMLSVDYRLAPELSHAGERCLCRSPVAR